MASAALGAAATSAGAIGPPAPPPLPRPRPEIVSASDNVGSIARQPAALCGLVGWKPTYGRVSRYGLIAFGSSLDCPGPVGRTVTDTALMLQVIAGPDPRERQLLKNIVYVGALSALLNIDPADRIEELKLELTAPTIAARPSTIASRLMKRDLKAEEARWREQGPPSDEEPAPEERH